MAHVQPSMAQVGVFAMGEEGLAAVENPSEMFLSERSSGPGVSSAVTVTLEGTRPLLLEVQALCSPTHQVRARPTQVCSEQRVSFMWP